MKLFKKLTVLCMALTLCLGAGSALVACENLGGDSSSDSVLESTSTSESNGDSSSTSSTDEAATYVYRVSVQNETGFGFNKVDVALKDASGNTVVSKPTNASGNANFFKEEITAGEYSVVVENIPDGYEVLSKNLTTSTSAGTTTTVVIRPTGLLQGEIPSASSYKLGDVMYDFTATLANGSIYKLSEVLQEKELVLINFWATWCGPCKSEFPAMKKAAISHEDSVSVLTISTTDMNAAAIDFMKSGGYSDTFNVGTVSGDKSFDKIHSMFGVNAIPHSVMIDRYGVVVFNEVGSMTSASDFTRQFNKFIGDDYIPTVVGNANEGVDPDEPTEDIRLEPNVKAPDVAALKQAFAHESASGFKFRYQEIDGVTPDEEKYDKYNWPWSISKDGDYIYASNIGIDSSYAILYSTMTAKAGDAIAFDYKIGTEERCDILYVMLDGEIIKQYSGNHADSWQTDYLYVFKDYEATEHEIAFVFMKDSETMSFEDVVQMKNLRIEKAEDIVESPNVNANIFRNAATDLNTDANATTQYKNYVDVVYSDSNKTYPELEGKRGDGYYHVGSVDGPILFANMLNESLWSKTSFWILAYSNLVVDNAGVNYISAIETYAWEASQITDVEGYTPVTEDLQYLLDVAVRYVQDEQKWAGDYHANEWLELCVYWEHYGATPLPEDPLAGISFSGAIELKAGENGSVKNLVKVPYALNPRGFKYKFIPEKSGAYKVYSTGTSNSTVFLVAEDRVTHLGMWDDKIFAELISEPGETEVYDGNFEFYWYFEKNVTYYLLFTTYLDQAAEYNVHLDYMGASYTYMDNAAVGPYSANLNTFELFLPDAIDYKYNEADGYYHHVKADGSMGGVIYLDLNRPTAFFNSKSIGDICKEAVNFEESKRALYVDGEDLTEYFYDLWFLADQNTGNKRGFTPVTQEIFEKLNKVTLSRKYDGIEASWLLFCYYDKTLSK